jgi:glycosyltransferase involved in cell wall biosynthesis
MFMSVALIYRNEILRLSETFIYAQGTALKSFRPQFIGLGPVNGGLEVPSPILLAPVESPAARLKRAAYQIAGLAPSFHRKARNTGAKLIHAHFFPDGVTAMALAKALEIPLIVTLHGYDVTRKKTDSKKTLTDRLQKKRTTHLWKNASLFLCVSEFIKQEALAVGFPQEKLRVHYTGIDLGYFVPSDAARKPGLVLFVGRLVEKKGVRYLLDAMAKVEERHGAAQLVIIGDGPERGALEKHAREKKVNCRFLGPQPQSVIREWLLAARVFCAPSVTAANGDSEGLGMVFAEAQATGLPVVSFAHGGIPEVVLHGETGLLAAEKDTEMLAKHLCSLLEDDALWKRYSERGVSWVAERFDLERQTKALEEIYREFV